MKILYIIVILFFIICRSYAQLPDIISNFKSGNAKELSAHFNNNIELDIFKNENTCSKSQAQQIIINFFNQYQPKNFIIIYQGGKENSPYVIGNLITKENKFRVYFLLRENKIYILRIEFTEF